MQNKKLHSQQYFTDHRDFWWHADFLELIGKRWSLKSAKSVLDVGSGQGHWSLSVLPILSHDATILGIEPEAKWREKALQKITLAGQNDRIKFETGSAEAIPYADNSFDIVTCQTVLIHVKDPIIALTEMKRVLKPGGLIIVSEPNNLAQQVILNSIKYHWSAKQISQFVYFQVTCERGKEALGEGNNMRGEMLPYYFSKIGLKDIDIYLSDMADYYIPPYVSDRQHAAIANEVDSIEKDYCVWDEQDTKRYFLSGGGTINEFNTYWQMALDYNKAVLKAIKANNFYVAGGGLYYLACGKK